MRRPFKNREAFRKIKESLISNYSEYISLNKTKENPSTSAGTSKEVNKPRYQNANMNKIFEKPFTPKTQKDHLFIPPQLNTYRDSLNQDKKIYNYTSQKYIENIYRVQTFLNHNPRATDIKEPNTNYITQKLQGYNKLIALPKKDIIRKENDIRNIRNIKNQNINIKNQEKDTM